MERTGIEPATPYIYRNARAATMAPTPLIRGAFGVVCGRMNGAMADANGHRTATVGGA